jgi:hypothetical protein
VQDIESICVDTEASIREPGHQCQLFAKLTLPLISLGPSLIRSCPATIRKSGLHETRLVVPNLLVVLAPLAEECGIVLRAYGLRDD